ncbi:MAG: SRPBCC domain-containing protein [bacterium]
MKTIRKEIMVGSPVLKVWKHLTDPNKLGTWLMPNDFEATAGKMFTFQCEPKGDWDGVVLCEIQEIIPMKKLVFSWTTNVIQVETKVTFTLQETKGQTRVELIHSGWDALPADKKELFEQFDCGWEIFFNQQLHELIES